MRYEVYKIETRTGVNTFIKAERSMAAAFRTAEANQGALGVVAILEKIRKYVRPHGLTVAANFQGQFSGVVATALGADFKYRNPIHDEAEGRVYWQEHASVFGGTK